MPECARILVVDDEALQRDIIADVLRAAGHEVGLAEGPAAGCVELERGAWDVVLTDWRMPDGGGARLLAEARASCPDAPVIVMTAYGSIAGAVEAVRLGAADYLSKPFDKAALLLAIDKGLAHRNLVAENRQLRARVGIHVLDEQLIGNSLVIQQLKQLLLRAAGVASTVLVTGESGVGKEVVARAIHAHGPRPTAPFVAVNCAALPASLIESELFGHEKGAFTGAERLTRGKFEQAGEGTLLLDEICSMPLDLQGKLLRTLQDRTITRVGGERTLSVKARIIAATNQNLEAAVRAGAFRADLFFRLHVLPIHVPPLRERLDDIPLLVAAFRTKLRDRLGGPDRCLSAEALAGLQHHTWPGNVRELENVLERLWVTTDGMEMTAADVAGALNGAVPAVLDDALAPAADGAAVTFLEHAGLTVDGLEARLIREALIRSDGQIRAAAELLGLSYKTMQYRIRKHGIQPGAGGAGRANGRGSDTAKVRP